MSWNLVAPENVAPSPWKNGGGVTRELLAWPVADEWRVRVSIADVEKDGPFSSFPGVQRWFAVLEGGGVRLRIGPCEHVLGATADALEFDGAATVQCELVGGPTRDFNLMVRGGGGSMRRVYGAMTRDCAGGSLVGVHALTPLLLEGVQVPAGHFAWRVLADAQRIDAKGDEMLWMEVR